MKLRQTECELRTQDYTRPGRFNDELQEALDTMRSALKNIAEEHSALWRDNSTSVAEYEAIRKAARQDIITEIGLILANFK